MGYGTDGLTFNTLRRANIKRLPLIRNSKGVLSHSKPDGSDWSPAQWLQAIVGELGEYANLHKKVERGDLSIEEAKPDLAKELADVLIYLDILAFRHGIDLGRAVMDKWNEVSERLDVPLYIDAEDWHYKLPLPESLQKVIFYQENSTETWFKGVGWYHADEAESLHGPFKTQVDAYLAYTEYCRIFL